MNRSFTTTRNQVLVIWFTGAAVLFVLILLQSAIGKFKDNPQFIWEWFMPSVLPTLTLIITSLTERSKKKVIPNVYANLCKYLSVFYLLILLLTNLMQPYSGIGPVVFFKQSNLWLAPLQGLVSASVGLLFVKSA